MKQNLGLNLIVEPKKAKKKKKKKKLGPGEARYQGSVVQSIVSLPSSSMTNSLTVVAEVFSNTLIFFAAKM